MKKILGFITALGIVGGVAPTVISCNTKQENSYKTALTKLMNRVETVIAANPNDNRQEMKALKEILLRAKDVQQKDPAQDQEYIEILNLLEEDLNDYQHPGYKKFKLELKIEIDDANKAILRNTKPKSIEVIDNLETAIIDAETVLAKEVECVKIAIAKQKLESRLKAYEEWNWDDNHCKNF